MDLYKYITFFYNITWRDIQRHVFFSHTQSLSSSCAEVPGNRKCCWPRSAPESTSNNNTPNIRHRSPRHRLAIMKSTPQYNFGTQRRHLSYYSACCSCKTMHVRYKDYSYKIIHVRHKGYSYKTMHVRHKDYTCQTMHVRYNGYSCKTMQVRHKGYSRTIPNVRHKSYSCKIMYVRNKCCSCQPMHVRHIGYSCKTMHVRHKGYTFVRQCTTTTMSTLVRRSGHIS